jgi:hypothetical protein
MLRPTHNGSSERATDREKRTRRALSGAAATAVLATCVIVLAGCGSSSAKASVDSSADTAFQKAGNTLCNTAKASIAPLVAHMASVEKNKQLPTLSDTKAVVVAQAVEQKALAALPGPASIKTARAKANSAFAAVIAREDALIKLHGAEMVAYSGIDPQLQQDAVTLQSAWKAIGLTACTK